MGVTIGKFTLESLTTGMYANPKIIYREYIQNSTDGIDYAIKAGYLKKDDSYIKINVNPENKSIIIIDNGCGVSSANSDYLTDIGNSKKHHFENRGFRGIGRLGGLSYCEKLSFITSVKGESVATELVWDCSKLKELVQPGKYDNYDLESVIVNVTSKIEKQENIDAHYFKVIMENVSDDQLLDVNGVEDYISQVSPVPFHHTKFVYASLIKDKFIELGQELEEYNIYFNNNPNPIYKPYQTWFKVKVKQKLQKDEILGISFFYEHDNNGELSFLGWYALTGWLGQLNDEVKSFRGLRLRKKNILIGDESSMDSFFTQSRFNKWTVGEIYVFAKLTPNARRDYFENNIEYQEFASILKPNIRNISKYPSKFSGTRKELTIEQQYESIKKDFEKGITSEIKRTELYKKIDNAKKFAKNIKNNPETSNNIIDHIKNQQIDNMRIDNKHKRVNPEKLIKDLTNLENKIINSKVYRINALSSKYPKEVRKILSKVFEIIDSTCTCHDTDKLIDSIITTLNKSNSKKVKTK